MPITKQTIAIIGAGGSMGAAIAKNIAGGNYRLLLFDKNPENLEAITDEIIQRHPKADLEQMDCAFDCSWEADIIIPAVPYEAEQDVADKIRDVATQKIVISVANPINEESEKPTATLEVSAAEQLQEALPHAKVVKAFNTSFAVDFDHPVIDGKRADVFIAGNDRQALETVSELVKTAGFNPIVAGELEVSDTLERMQLLLMQLGVRYNYSHQAGWKILHN